MKDEDKRRERLVAEARRHMSDYENNDDLEALQKATTVNIELMKLIRDSSK